MIAQHVDLSHSISSGAPSLAAYDCPSASEATLKNVGKTTQVIMTSSNGNIFRITGPLWGEFTGPGGFPSQRPVARSFDALFNLSLNKRLDKQSRRPWFEKTSRSLWRHCNVNPLKRAHINSLSLGNYSGNFECVILQHILMIKQFQWNCSQGKPSLVISQHWSR